MWSTGSVATKGNRNMIISKKAKTLLRLGLASSVLLAVVPASAALPKPGMKIDKHTAVVITDPPVDFVSPEG